MEHTPNRDVSRVEILETMSDQLRDCSIAHFFIADFYCAEKRFVLELDGKKYDYQKDRDKERGIIMRTLGLKVLHVRNDESAIWKK